MLRAYGAEVVVCPTAVAPEHPDSYYNVSDRLVRETPGAWKPDQYSNPNNPASHYDSTGPELWEQTDGRITHFVAGVGTGGTISGTGRYLKDVSKGAVQVVGADPEGSVYSGGSGRPYLVEGVGEDFWPTAYDRTVADEIVAVSDKDSFQMTRRLAKEEGLLVGGSCGMAVVAALRVAERLGPDDVVVVLLPDSGRGYLSKIFNDDWMQDYGFLDEGGPESVVGDVLARKDALEHGGIPQFVHMHPQESVGEAVRAPPRVRRLPAAGGLARRGPPGRDGRRGHRLDRGAGPARRPLRQALRARRPDRGSYVGRRCRWSAPASPITRLMAVLERADAAVVLVEGKPQGIVTRQDLLSFMAEHGVH